MAHAGNTRIHLLRSGRLMALTYDHTVGGEMLTEGKIDVELYHALPERLKLTSGVGILWDPVVQTRSGNISNTDLIIMTTDGKSCLSAPQLKYSDSVDECSGMGYHAF